MQENVGHESKDGGLDGLVRPVNVRLKTDLLSTRRDTCAHRVVLRQARGSRHGYPLCRHRIGEVLRQPLCLAEGMPSQAWAALIDDPRTVLRIVALEFPRQHPESRESVKELTKVLLARISERLSPRHGSSSSNRLPEPRMLPRATHGVAA